MVLLGMYFIVYSQIPGIHKFIQFVQKPDKLSDNRLGILAFAKLSRMGDYMSLEPLFTHLEPDLSAGSPVDHREPRCPKIA